jgi:uncharacterized protein (DUF934 family)
MALLEAGRLRADPYRHLADDAPLPATAPVLVSLERLLRDSAALRAHDAPLGVLLPPDADPQVLRPMLDRLALVALQLRKSRDGRAFTQARRLRETLGFTGELRMVGHVLPDHYAFLLRLGVSTVEVSEGTDVAVWEASKRVIPIAYQAAVSSEAPLSLLRRRLTPA